MPLSDTRTLTAHVPVDLAEKIDIVASRLDRSRNWVIKQALAGWIEQEEMHHRLTLEALEDVDSGQVIDHTTVQAWAKSLSTAHPLAVPR